MATKADLWAADVSRVMREHSVAPARMDDLSALPAPVADDLRRRWPMFRPQGGMGEYVAFVVPSSVGVGPAGCRLGIEDADGSGHWVSREDAIELAHWLLDTFEDKG